jgi:hypothetical protein
MAYTTLTGDDNPETSTVGSFLGNLPEFLGALAVDPRTIIAICEFEDHRYVQFWLQSPEYFVAEVISNLNIGDAVALSPEDEAALLGMGWNPPEEDGRPNWYLDGHSVADLIEIIGLTARAVTEVLGETPERTITIRTFEGQRRLDGQPGDEDSLRVYQREFFENYE